MCENILILFFFHQTAIKEHSDHYSRPVWTELITLVFAFDYCMFGSNFSELFIRDTRPEKIYISNAHCACKPVKSEKCSDQMFGGFLLSIFVNSAAVSSSTEKCFMLLEQFFLNMWKQEFVLSNHNKIQMTASVAPMKRCRIHKFHS